MASSDSQTGPRADATWLQDVQQAFFTQRCLHVAARLGIADLVRDGPQGVDRLSRQAEVDCEQLYRVLRFLASRGVFVESSGRSFALTDRGQILRSDIPNSARWMLCHDVVARGSMELLHSVRTGESGFEKTYGESLWQYLSAHPEESDWFNRHMQSQATGLATPVIAAYDWSGVRTVVDVGGGTGLFLASLLQRHPHLSGILVDRPDVVASAAKVLESVSDRCRVSAGNFLEKVSAKGDLYVLSRILHDWDDEHAVKILRVVHAAMPAGARLLVLEMVVPPDDKPHPAKMMDIAMMAVFGRGRERTVTEFDALLRQGGFRLAREIPTSAPTRILEAERLS